MNLVPLHEARSQPITVTGCVKGGTTLITRLLNNHPDFMLDYENHLPYSLLDWYEKAINDPIIKLDFYDNLCREINHKRFPEWTGQKVREFFSGFHSGYDEGKRWGSTTKMLGFKYDFLNQLWPNALWIAVLRDPRDIYASLRLAKWNLDWIQEGRKDPIRMVKGVGYYFNTCCKLALKPGVITIRYEDIVKNPTYIYTRLGLEVPVEYMKGLGYIYWMRTLQPKKLGTTAETTEDKVYDRVGRWKNEVSPEIANLIEEECAWAFDLGYYYRSR